MKTLFIGQNFIHLKVVNSTNSYASELLRQIKPVEGTLIYSFDQQKGRGQRGTIWESEPNKNAALSFILYPTFLHADKQFLFNKITSLAVADLMSELLDASDKKQEVKIKWPNDIYVGNKKIAGILIENTLRENTIQTSILGIGININQKIFSPNINANSLAMLTNKEFDLMQVIERLCEFMEVRYLQLKANKLESIDNEYLQRLYQLEVWCNYFSNDQLFKGKIIGTSAMGKLQVQLKSGEAKEFNLKEISFV
jgi:BirA family biotin operon repressor/biotin-[acetyl-CoA-carboxylase] ligase